MRCSSPGAPCVLPDDDIILDDGVRCIPARAGREKQNEIGNSIIKIESLEIRHSCARSLLTHTTPTKQHNTKNKLQYARTKRIKGGPARGGALRQIARHGNGEAVLAGRQTGQAARDLDDARILCQLQRAQAAVGGRLLAHQHAHGLAGGHDGLWYDGWMTAVYNSSITHSAGLE